MSDLTEAGVCSKCGSAAELVRPGLCRTCRNTYAREWRQRKVAGNATETGGPPHGTNSRYNNNGCRCERCTAAAREAWARQRTIAPEANRRGSQKYRARHPEYRHRRREAGNARYQAESGGAAAPNARKEWTGPELEIVSRDDLTARVQAAMLGRSFKAVRKQRWLLHVDPRKINLAGVAR